MSEKHPGPLVVEGKLTDAERMKVESNYLRVVTPSLSRLACLTIQLPSCHSRRAIR
jgi:hypothetical protein